jgi:hypothetical protein
MVLVILLELVVMGYLILAAVAVVAVELAVELAVDLAVILAVMGQMGLLLYLYQLLVTVGYIQVLLQLLQVVVILFCNFMLTEVIHHKE